MTKATQQSPSIGTRAMLINLSVGYWGGKTGDERMIDDITKVHHNERDAVDAKKILINPAALNAVKAVRSRARAYYFTKTSPWIDGGTRVLASAFYFEVMEKLREFGTEYEQAVHDHVIKNYAALKGEARKRLGSLYNDADYPAPALLKNKYSWSLSVLPVPDAGDWRVDLGSKTNTEIQKQIAEQVKDACAVVTRDLWNRLHKVVAKMSERLHETDGAARQSMIDGIKECCDILPAMNVAGDAKLDAMVAEVKDKLTKIPAVTLRDDGKLAKVARDAADDLLAKMAGYVGGK